jgi:hypothetical protein
MKRVVLLAAPDESPGSDPGGVRPEKLAQVAG